MAIDIPTVERIARLSRIETTEDERAELAHELTSILDWIRQLDEIDTQDVEPMTSVAEMVLKSRPDTAVCNDTSADVTRNAPVSHDHFFVVPKVVE